MSLLEDVFLQDEANEAQELERVIEGDEYDEIPRALSPNSDDDSEKDDEAEEDKRRVDPNQGKTKRVVKNPRFILNPARLTGPRGLQVIPEHFKDFKFKGKGYEKDDLDMVLKKLEHWAYRLYPKFKFEDCLKKIETLGKKRPVMVHLHKIRTDQFTSEETVVQKDSSDDEETTVPPQEDEFDKLLQQQIELARATPAPGSKKKPGISTPKFDKSPLTMPKAASSPSISDEQRERILTNRRLAEERRLVKLNQNSTATNINNEMPTLASNIDASEKFHKVLVARKHNRSNIIDSFDDECDLTSVNQSVVVDVHKTVTKNSDHNIENNINNHDVEQSDVDDEMVTEIIDGDLNDKLKESNPNTVDNSILDEGTNSNMMLSENICFLNETSNTNCNQINEENLKIITNSVAVKGTDVKENRKECINDTNTEIPQLLTVTQIKLNNSSEGEIPSIFKGSTPSGTSNKSALNEEILEVNITARDQGIGNDTKVDDRKDQENSVVDDNMLEVMDVDFSDDF